MEDLIFNIFFEPVAKTDYLLKLLHFGRRQIQVCPTKWRQHLEEGGGGSPGTRFKSPVWHHKGLTLNMHKSFLTSEVSKWEMNLLHSSTVLLKKSACLSVRHPTEDPVWDDTRTLNPDWSSLNSLLLTGSCFACHFLQVQPGDPDLRHRPHQRPLPQSTRRPTPGQSSATASSLH